MKHVGRGWLAALGLIAALGCRPVVNYPSLLGPRYAGGEASMRRGAAPSRIRVVTFNVQFGRHVDRLIELLQLAGSADGADIVTLQEVDPAQTDRLAQALGMAYVYYPAVVHPRSGRDFGNAVLSRWPIVDDRKVVLPHHGRFRDSQRAATAATVVVGDDSLRVYSVHLSTMVEVAPSSRREQARTVLADAARLRRVVVGGDLNGVGVGDEFEACGFLWPTKDNAPTHHVFTWDHIFLRGLVVRDSASTGVVEDDAEASDHRPVWIVAWLEPSTDAGRGSQGAGGESGPPGGCAALR
ncbi:MAG: endonuclease/exonuclease/phosphatase family protein [Gemmatimonadetes bacterium]|nr:endonuclease/exonuclease/phosphatase family protein [Gemmatimonadota bacterium]MBI2536471.1 endonuclease/exonuclease/phosphatase family protein [Gemmatimonadota bacterium]